MCLRIFRKYAYLFFVILVAVKLLHEDARVRAAKNAVNIEYIQQCTEQKYADVESPVTDIRMYKLNRTTKAYSLRFAIKRPWDEDVGFKMELEIWGYAGWTRVPYIPLQPNFCLKFMTMFRTLSADVFMNLGQNLSLVCPIPPGEYALKNYTSKHPYYLPFNGRFRLRVVILSIKTKRVIMCLTTLANVEEIVE